MSDSDPEAFGARLVESLYSETLLLADEARGYFDGAGRIDRETLGPLARVGFACESLKVTTRLMHTLSWLLGRRALVSDGGDASRPASAALGQVQATSDEALIGLPEAARALIGASVDIHARVGRMDVAGGVPSSPARALMSRLERAF